MSKTSSNSELAVVSKRQTEMDVKEKPIRKRGATAVDSTAPLQKVKRRRARGPRSHDPFYYDKIVEIPNSQLHGFITPKEMTFVRAAVTCGNTDRIHEMIVHRLFANPDNFEMVYKMWMCNFVVFRPHRNAAQITDEIVRWILRSEWYMTFEIGSSGANYVHCFGKSEESNIFMLPLHMFDSVLCQCFSTLLSRADASVHEDEVTGQIIVTPSSQPTAAGTFWRKMRSLILLSFFNITISTVQPKLRDRTRSQLAECAAICGNEMVAKSLMTTVNMDWRTVHEHCIKKLA